jgi:hypothetical protein
MTDLEKAVLSHPESHAGAIMARLAPVIILFTAPVFRLCGGFTTLFALTPGTVGRRHCSCRRLLSMTDSGSPPPPAGFALGRRSHPKIL